MTFCSQVFSGESFAVLGAVLRSFRFGAEFESVGLPHLGVCCGSVAF